MNRNLVIMPHAPSNSANALKEALDCRRLYADRRLARQLPVDARSLVVNFGSSQGPTGWTIGGARILNPFLAVRRAVSKIETARRLRAAGVPCIALSTDFQDAQRWHDEGKTVLCRQDRRSGGEGIAIWDRGRAHPPEGNHHFFSLYFPKTAELRFHVFGGQVIDVVQKKRRTAAAVREERTPMQRMIRSHANDWIFAHDALGFTPDQLTAIGANVAIPAVRALGLDFGAVDVLVNVGRGGRREATVCEVNTAPGLENTQTIQAYTQAITRAFNEHTGR